MECLQYKIDSCLVAETDSMLIQTRPMQFEPVELEEVFGRIRKEGVLLRMMSGFHYASELIFLTTYIHIYHSQFAAHRTQTPYMMGDTWAGQDYNQSPLLDPLMFHYEELLGGQPWYAAPPLWGQQQGVFDSTSGTQPPPVTQPAPPPGMHLTPP
jgi:hypothetical protein